MNDIKSRIRYLIDEIFGNQSRLAESLGVFPAAISNYTLGRLKPTSEVLQKFIEIGISVNWLWKQV